MVIAGITKQSIHNIAIYLRISKDDGDREESESISNQRFIILNFINKNFEYDRYFEYIDDGVSGATFNRPGFKKMITELKTNQIDLVITKNLARFGRNYIEAGAYIEKIFPDNNIRYIAILDEIDNFADRISNEFAPIKGVFNELFCKETSKSIKKSKRKKMREGIYSCVVAPYGYKKDPDNKGKLIIDEVASKIVRKIFDLRLKGKTAKEIADILNEEEIPTPAIYLKIRGLENKTKKVWTRHIITKLLANEVYIGRCVRGKTQKVSYKSKERVNIRRNDQIKTDNTHVGIVSLEEFEKIHANSSFGKIIYNRENIKTKFIDFMYCGECGHKMTRRKSRNYFNVLCFNGIESNKLCTNQKKYKYDDIEKIIIKNIEENFAEYFKRNNLSPNLIKKYNKIQINKIDETSKEMNKKLGMIKFKISKLYNDRLQNNIDEELYKNTYKQLTEKRAELNASLETLEISKKKILDENENMNKFDKIKKILKNLNKDTLSSEDISELIEKIIIYSDHIHIFYKFERIPPKIISC